MTGEEVFKALDAQNRKALAEAGGVDSDVIMHLLNQASLRGFKFGSETALSMVQAALAVKKAAI